MAAKSRKRPRSDREADFVPEDLRREDAPPTRPEQLPPVGSNEEFAVGGGFSPKEDGGVAQHPIHDEDQEDATPSDYERELDRLDAVARSDKG